LPTVETRDATLYYEVHGREGAPAVVFAHGAGGNRMSWWQQVPVFAREHRVLTFDHRTFGRSACAPEHFTTGEFVADLLAVMDAEGIERAALVCQSMGGWTGLPTALAHPQRVRALVLCDTPGGLFDAAVSEAMRSIGGRAGREGIQAHAALAPDFPQRRPDLTQLYAQISDLNTGVDAGVMAAALFAAEARIDPSALDGFRVPTLVVAGAHDLLFPIELMRHVAGLIPGAQLREFPDCGHSTYFEEPETFNACVGEFVDKYVD
jgi:pimeloyl-ACP methyl ester carboxylesterase